MSYAYADLHELSSDIGVRLENFIYEVIEKRFEKRYRIDEFLGRAAEIIEDTVKERLGKDISCDKHFEIQGDEWARLFVECSVPGKRIVVRVPLRFDVKLPEGVLADYTDINIDEVIVFEK
jgi:hypothetical protein